MIDPSGTSDPASANVLCVDSHGNLHIVSRATLIPRASAYCVLRAGTGLVLVRDIASDRWDFPGGAVEPGETPAQAAAREFREETGAVASGSLTPLASFTEYFFDVSKMLGFESRRHYFLLANADGDLRHSGNGRDIAAVAVIQESLSDDLVAPIVRTISRLLDRESTTEISDES